MIYLYVIYNVIAVLCIVYAVFNFMDVASWGWVKSKTFFVWFYNLIKGKK